MAMAVKILAQRLSKNASYGLNFLLKRAINTTNAFENVMAKSTVDQVDVENHAKLTKDWWDLKGPAMPLHSYNFVRVPFIQNALASYEPHQRTFTPLKGKSILDVGCGGGILSEALARLGADVTGVDAGEDMVQVAKEHSQADFLLENKPTYICATIEEHADTHEGVYDGVVASEIIEHVVNKELFVKSCVRTLKPGGRIFFTTPNRTQLADLFVIYVCENVLKIIPKGTHEIEKFITPEELEDLLKKNGCGVEVRHGVIYIPPTNTWMFTYCDQLMYALQARKITSVA